MTIVIFKDLKMRIMRYLYVFCLSALVGFTACTTKQKNDNAQPAAEYADAEKSEPTADVKFPVYDFDGLEPLLNKDDNKTYIINFWATWCKPCIEEMPSFEKTYAEQQANGVELVLVSLDMPSMWKSRLEPFVEKKGLKGKVVILDDPKMNDWIPKVDENWGGGIPATLIYNKEKRVFFEHGFTYDELNEELNKFL